MTTDEATPIPIFEEERTDLIGGDGRPGGTRKRKDCGALTLLTGAQAGMVFVLDALESVLGRGQGCDLRIDDGALSRRHCRILRRDQDYLLEDLDSSNGTFVADGRLAGPRKLANGDRIQIGATLMKFALQDDLEAQAIRRLYDSAMNDPLTGVHNRRYLQDRLEAEFAFASRHGSSMSILLFDADHFKRINDSWGHPAGDVVLKAIADRIKRTVRVEDLVARYGGEEFAVLARGIRGDGAMVLAERIRTAVGGFAVPVGDKQISVTISVGVAIMDATRTFASAEALLGAADSALYKAKEEGRNRCVRA